MRRARRAIAERARRHHIVGMSMSPRRATRVLALALLALAAPPALADGRTVIVVTPAAPVTTPPPAYIPPPMAPAFPPPVAVPQPLPPTPPQVTSFTPPRSTVVIVPDRRH